MIQFIQHVQEMADVSCDAVKSSNEHDVKAVSSSIRHELVKSRSLGFAPRNYVCVFVCNFVSALFGQFAKVEQLGFEMLVSRRNSAIQYYAFHFVNSLYRTSYFFVRFFLPFLIPGSSLRTRLTSELAQGRTSIPPIRRDFGALILPAEMYRWRLMRLIPSIWATLSVEYVFILLHSVTDTPMAHNTNISIGAGISALKRIVRLT